MDAVSDAHAAGGDHDFSLTLPETPVTVLGDSARLTQVVTNLLTNARVHTPEGTKVSVRLSRNANSAVFAIEDNGPGIPADAQDVLFERFARADVSRSRASGSTGLGLAIVKAIVEGHGGTVTVQTEPGRTAFTVDLPLAEPALPEEVA